MRGASRAFYRWFEQSYNDGVVYYDEFSKSALMCETEDEDGGYYYVTLEWADGWESTYYSYAGETERQFKERVERENNYGKRDGYERVR